MYFKHKLFGLIFNIFRIFPLKSNQITFIMDKNESFIGNYEYILNEFNKVDSNYKYTFFIKDKLSFSNFYRLATSKYIFLNDNFFPIAFMNFNKDTKIIQLWHAPGAFKKFGYSILKDKSRKKLLTKLSEKTSYLTVTSHNISKFYSEAFDINEDKILSLGIPRTDYYSKKNLDNLNQLRADFEKKYPQVKNKKIVLYAPTFRENPKYNNVFDFFNVEEFNEELSEDYILIVRLHPKIDKFMDENSDLLKILNSNNIINCTHYKNEQELLLLSDILVTDYSSIMIEFSFLNKPCIFFSYDLNEYEKEERGFYFDYNNVPGPIVYNTKQLIDIIKESTFDFNKIQNFTNYQFDYLDSNSSKRIVEYLLKN
ncbi:MAG: CDP-glycerol glycerophosphotransferase family protein [Methanobacteriaceae archaeon]|nr:CDP-glycerol glycerophosphotransferase family protein [Methanobacteriaceae archaeon]